MSTKHSKAAEKFLQDSKMAAWHNETLWMVRAKRDKMSKEVPANGAIVHLAIDAD